MKVTIIYSIICAIVIGLSVGCGSPPTSSSDLPLVPSGSTPTPILKISPTPDTVLGNGEDIYRIGPGDLLKITVYEESDISGNFRVSREGYISWSWVGRVKISGLSVSEINRKLVEILTRDYISSPRVEIDVAEYRSQIIYFFGNVKNPGVTRLGENKTLLFNLLKTGGPKIWGEGQITILKRDRSRDKITISLADLLRGEITDQIQLQNGDIITLSSPASGPLMTEDRIYIVGSVKKPSSIPWRENITALDALMEVGGLAENASGNSARLIRGKGEEKEEIDLELGDILDGEKAKNILLFPGDQIIVPESWL